MKTFILISLLIFSNVSIAQLTYSASPTSAAGATCPSSGTLSCSGSNLFDATIKAYVSNISGSNVTFTIVKCNGTAFSAGSYMLKSGGYCATLVSSGTIAGGASFYTVTLSSLCFVGATNYVFTFTSTTSGLKYYSNTVTVTGNCGSNNVDPANVTFSNIKCDQITSYWPNVVGAQYYNINYTLCSNPSYSGATSINSSGLSADLTGLNSGTSYKMQIQTVYGCGCASTWSQSTPCQSTMNACSMTNSNTVSNVTTNGFTANWNAVSNASSYNIKVKKCTDLNYNSPVLSTSTSNTSLAISGLSCNECYLYQVQAVCGNNCGSGTWSPSNTDSAKTSCPMPNNSSIVFSNSTANSFTATWTPVSGVIGYEVNYTTCSGTFTYQGLLTTTNSITITGIVPSTSYKIQVRAKCNSTCYSNWSPASTTCVSTSAPCVNGSGTTPILTSNEYIATEYLCTNNIILPAQNWTDNFNLGIKRKDIAKIVYLSLFKGITPNSPAKYFPVPFSDMQSVNANNTYWIDAVKCLAYLQYDDENTALDRDFVKFNPDSLIRRDFAAKLFCEAFNIAPDWTTPSPFSDIDNTWDDYGYVKALYNLGVVLGNTSCSSGICFQPTSNLTRQDAFIILWRILSFSSITKPTNSTLTTLSKYFIPNNLRFETLSKVPQIYQGNFNHYQKNSFDIAGRSSGLDFTHTYNSHLTELPKGYFDSDHKSTSSQHFYPLGVGWTHTYHIYAQRISDGLSSGFSKYLFYFPDGSISVYDYNTLVPDGIGCYDSLSRMTLTNGEQLTLTTKEQKKYVFESYNNGDFYFIQSIKDRNNNGVKMTYASTSVVPSVAKYKLSTVQEVFYNGSTGRSLSFYYVSTISLYLSSVVDNSINRTIYFTVNVPNRNLSTYTDPKGNQTTYNYASASGYNTKNLLTEIILPKGNKIQNTYLNRKLQTSKTFNSSNVVTSTSQVNWASNYSIAGYNSSSIVTDPNNRTTTYTHNTNGNPIQINSPQDTIAFNTYDVGLNANLPKNITVNGQNSIINYNTKGDILNMTKNNITNTFTYNAWNDILTHKDGRGNITTYTYDAIGNLMNIIRPTGDSTKYTRNAYGQIATITNPSGITTTFGFDANGLVNSVSMPLGITTTSIYDNASRLISSTDARGKTTTNFYDANDNLLKTIDANGDSTVNTYDNNNNHLTIKNAKGEIQTMTYNWDDDSRASESFGTHTKSNTYYPDGKIAIHTRGNGTFNYSYEALTGRLSGDGHTTYTYWPNGNVKTVTNASGTLQLDYDVNNRLENYSDIYGRNTTYGYDSNSNVTSITYPGSKKVTYIYDAMNRCISVTDWNGKITTYTYLKDDRVFKITLPNGSNTTYGYDLAGRLVSIYNRKANGTVISSDSFTLDSAGFHKSEISNHPSLPMALQNMVNQSVTYGAYPNNIIQTQGATAFSHNTAGGISTKGTDSFTYNIYDQILTAKGSLNATYTYDGAGHRRQRISGGTTTRYVQNILGMSQVLIEANGTNVVQYYYVYGPSGLLYRLSSDNTYSYYHYDYRGSTIAMTDDTQHITHSYSYDPFGKLIAANEANYNPFRYVGQQGVMYESPNLTYMRARYYDPSTGRFLSEDPIWALNLYPYADGNPVMGIDPKGENTLNEIGGDFLYLNFKNMAKNQLSYLFDKFGKDKLYNILYKLSNQKFNPFISSLQRNLYKKLGLMVTVSKKSDDLMDKFDLLGNPFSQTELEKIASLNPVYVLSITLIQMENYIKNNLNGSDKIDGINWLINFGRGY